VRIAVDIRVFPLDSGTLGDECLDRWSSEPWAFKPAAGGTCVPMTKTELHRFVDDLPEESLEAAAVLLRRARDPVVAKLDASPYDDEELSEQDLRAIREARSEPGVVWPEAKAELNAC
jgi:hypothetical protein